VGRDVTQLARTPQLQGQYKAVAAEAAAAAEQLGVIVTCEQASKASIMRVAYLACSAAARPPAFGRLPSLSLPLVSDGNISIRIEFSYIS